MAMIGIANTHVVSRLATQYRAKVLALSPLAYWPLDELSGSTADNAQGTAARDGSYSGVTLNSTAGPGALNRAGLWDGANDHCDIYSASLAGAFNGDEGTLSVWFKVSAAGVWTDGTTRYFAYIGVDANNYVYMRKNSGNNAYRVEYKAGGTAKAIAVVYSATSWTHLGLTWSAATDEVKLYQNGTKTGATGSSLGTWAGSPASTTTLIGAFNITPTSVMDGYLAHVALWSSALTGPQMASLATI
jgi:hypothetical protein